jgi:hypothetical protein
MSVVKSYENISKARDLIRTGVVGEGRDEDEGEGRC